MTTLTRKSKTDWLIEGIHVLNEMGAQELKIDILAKRLGVTKGSFYHHFKDYEDYQESLLQLWENEGTLRIITMSENADSPEKMLDKIIEIATHTEIINPEIGIRAWALQDARVRAYQQRVDQQRLEYSLKIFRHFAADEHQALLIARLFYALLIGAEQMIPPIRQEEFWELYREFKRLYGISSDTPK